MSMREWELTAIAQRMRCGRQSGARSCCAACPRVPHSCD